MAFSISKYSHPSAAPMADTDNFKSKKSRPSYLFENMAQASGCLIGRVGTLLNPTPLKDDVLKNLFTFNDVLDIWLDDPRATGNKLEATSRIKHTAETRSKFLDLSDLDLNTSPPLGALKSHLISIDFSNNKLTEIPENLFPLKELVTINFRNNKLRVTQADVRDLIGGLEKLKSLILSNNTHVEKLPPLEDRVSVITSDQQGSDISGLPNSSFQKTLAVLTTDVNQPDFPSQLLESLQEDENLRSLYAKSAGVGEGYTVLEHTKLVLEGAAKWRSSVESDVVSVVNWKEWLVFLALHDIGKGLAKEMKYPQPVTSIKTKEDELTKTKEIICDVMKCLGTDKKTIDIFSALLAFDTQGLYLREEIGIEEAFDNIIEMASTAQVSLKQMYGLLESFHKIDAASYPFLLDRIFKEGASNLMHSEKNQQLVDNLRGYITKAEEGEDIFKMLTEQARKTVPSEERIAALIQENSEKLPAYPVVT